MARSARRWMWTFQQRQKPTTRSMAAVMDQMVSVRVSHESESHSLMSGMPCSANCNAARVREHACMMLACLLACRRIATWFVA